MISDKDLALLTNRLHIPLIITDILDGRGEFKDREITADTEYSLHEQISNLQLDSALLCLALCAKKIAGIYQKASPSMNVMNMEADRILDSYSQLCLSGLQEGDIDDADILDTLQYIAEDLEGIAELFELNVSFLRAKDKTAAHICDILGIQARAHTMVAEVFSSAALGHVEGTGEAEMPVLQPAIAKHALVGQDTPKDNVISFPTKTS